MSETAPTVPPDVPPTERKLNKYELDAIRFAEELARERGGTLKQTLEDSHGHNVSPKEGAANSLGIPQSIRGDDT